MTKVPVKKQETALTVTDMNQFLPAGVTQADLVRVTSPDSRLPSLKLVYPIEIDGQRLKPEHAYAFGMSQGDGFEPLPAGIILTVLAARDSTRQLQVEVNGKKVAFDKNNPEHKKLEKSYTRLFKAIGTFNASDAAYVESLKDGSYQRGIDYLVAVLLPDGGCAIADLPAYKTASSYWHRPLRQALRANRLGAQINIANHAVNVVAAKSDPTMKYVGPDKFNQFQIVELTEEQAEAIHEAMGNARADIEGWFNR